MSLWSLATSLYVHTFVLISPPIYVCSYVASSIMLLPS